MSQDFSEEHNIFTKFFDDAQLIVDFNNEQITYPESQGLKVNRQQICNFQQNENFVVFECVHRLLEKGYKPKHLEIEPKWKVGHGASGGRADILVKNQRNKPLLLIECKTAGKEFEKAWRNTKQDGDQLFSYAQQIPATQFLCLYASDFVNQETTFSRRIIAHIDNTKTLEQNKKLVAFKDATDVKSRFAVWRDTYQLESTESGVFEEDIQPYQIGKHEYTYEYDTKTIDVADKTGQYHRFRTILRQHNIARRENAFEVLVNLFLCKIVDEENNKEKLKFYWKGLAYDNYFDFVDRLQDLYQKGMSKFLNEEISYISNEQIENAFWAVKHDRNATKRKIQDYFRELKFFTNSAFSFVDTHNEKLFKKNAKVLVEVVKMWQGLRLTTGEQNQFLGDMFEYFLDNGIKQSNGQFFTPLPICKFIVSSLPLAQKIKDQHDPLRVIDYACGAGHFLTEYAYQIKSLVDDDRMRQYYANITGIEKEDRLAKVAKVSAYMYGQREINILDADALSAHEGVRAESFDMLVANPPFAVEGFLQTLSDDDKKHYSLIQATGETSNTNTIQCFFLERARHLMAAGGVVGVIVPSSILSNTDNVHIRTRELLLQYFDIVSIVELGGGTFGKTGTNTVVLFLRRKSQRPEPAEHYKNRVEDFFAGDKEAAIYQDEHLIKAYCRHIDVPYEGPKDSQKNIGPIPSVGKDKLYYFMLAHEQPEKVLVVKSPDKKDQQKQFLGYEWSSRKGAEGIKYIGGDTVHDVVTPLFDPSDLDNSEKINTAIRNNFNGITIDSLPQHCRYVRLIDMLDFSRDNFDKTITLNPQANIAIQSKWSIVMLGDVAETQYGYTEKSHSQGAVRYLRITDITERGELKNTGKKYINPSPETKQKYTLKENDIVIARSGSAGRMFLCKDVHENLIFASYLVRITLSKDILAEYVFSYYQTNYYWDQVQALTTTLTQPNLNAEKIKQIKIPLPPLAEQKKIVAKCKAVDREGKNAHQAIVTAQQKIQEKMLQIVTAGYEAQNLGEVASIIAGQSPKSEFYNFDENGLPFYQGKKEFGNIYLLEPTTWTKKTTKESVKGDILMSIRAPVGDVNINPFEKICIGRGLAAIRVNKSILQYYLFFFIRQNKVLFAGRRGMTFDSISRKELSKINVPVPPLDIQQQLVDDVEKLQAKITQAQTVIDSSAARKNSILGQHL